MTAASAFDKSIGFLLADVSRLLRKDFDGRVRALGMTQVQWRAIAHIAREEGINQSALAERLEVQPITIGRLIDRMQAAGWVTRRADAADRRVSLLYLTPKAKPVLERLQVHADEAIEALMQGIARNERQLLVDVLERMKLNLAGPQEHAPAGGGDDENDDRRKRKTG